MYQVRASCLWIGESKPVPARPNGGTGVPLDTSVMFLDCPGYMDTAGATRCGLPAVVEHRYTMTSTDGPLEGVRIRCPRGHFFNGPLELMLWNHPVASPFVADEVADDAAARPHLDRGRFCHESLTYRAHPDPDS